MTEYVLVFSYSICLFLLSACNGQLPSAGIVKDLNTGLTATYTHLKPESVSLVMNDEEIKHTDIPLGESFLIVNKGLKGFHVKDGKVAVGCSLNIKSSSGEVLLNENDLYKGNDIFSKDSITYLRCTVSTGSPMKWEEHYNVTVIFWDKYGEGKIENNVTIRCIDIP